MPEASELRVARYSPIAIQVEVTDARPSRPLRSVCDHAIVAEGVVRPSGVRLTELLAALSLGTDLGMGHPMEHVLRQSLIALRLADRVGLDEGERSRGCVDSPPGGCCWATRIYGQGMTAAALQAEALGHSLDRAKAIDRSLTRSYFRAAARVVAVPWSIAVGGDFVYAGTTGEKPFGTDLMNRYFARVTVAGQYDEQVVRRMNEVLSLVLSPSSLLRPIFVIRVLIRSRRHGPTGNRYGALRGERPGSESSSCDVA